MLKKIRVSNEFINGMNFSVKKPYKYDCINKYSKIGVNDLETAFKNVGVQMRLAMLMYEEEYFNERKNEKQTK